MSAWRLRTSTASAPWKALSRPRMNHSQLQLGTISSEDRHPVIQSSRHRSRNLLSSLRWKSVRLELDRDAPVTTLILILVPRKCLESIAIEQMALTSLGNTNRITWLSAKITTCTDYWIKTNLMIWASDRPSVPWPRVDSNAFRLPEGAGALVAHLNTKRVRSVVLEEVPVVQSMTTLSAYSHQRRALRSI